MPPPFWIRSLGGRGEYWARRYLHRRGYHLLARNWRSGKAELDLAMANAQRVLFVEVKTRRKRHQRRLADLIHPRQEQRLTRIADQFLRQYPVSEIPWQFVLIEVVPQSLLRVEIRMSRLTSAESYLKL
ncbi:MAG: YraN family protein [Acidobacteria bacterium]|nr:YraN family protein [Acidobacteriota bacterium]